MQLFTWLSLAGLFNFTVAFVALTMMLIEMRRTMIMMITEMIVIVVEVRFAIIQLAVIRGYLHFLLRGRFFTVSLMAIFTLFTCGQIIWFCQAVEADTAEVYI